MSELLVSLGLVAVGCAVPCALLGNYLVLRRMSLLADAIGHAVLPGIAVGFLLTEQLSGWPVMLGAALFGLLMVWLSNWLGSFGRLAEDASLGVVFTALFALGVILLTYAARVWHADLDPGCVLYGQLELSASRQVNVLGWFVPASIWETLLPVNLLVFGVIICLWKELQLAVFDPEWAQASGFAARQLLHALLGLVALVCVAVFREVGSILVLALLVVPAATAWLLARRLWSMVTMSVMIAVIGSCLGCWWAVQYNWNTAGSISAALGGLFALAVVISPRQGLLAQVARRGQLLWRIACEDVLALFFRVEEAAAQGRLAKSTVNAEDLRRLVGIWSRAILFYLRWRGQVVGEAGEWRLTESGRQRARQVVRSHRLWESWLQRHFPLPLDHLHEVAERMEHYVTPALQEEIARELGPTRDPHGREIPPQESSSPRH
ncbi:MAG: metal ABC transporter permease [Gemmatales bacterium]|nr:metal ABC transporter permease [Gemmatales bacterium]MDW7995525.1 metal ABC transporter permease [Gemmatales bacterium]